MCIRDSIKFHSFYFGIPKIEDESGESNSSLGGMDYFSPSTSTLDKIEQRFLGVKKVGTKTINSQAVSYTHLDLEWFMVFSCKEH